MSRRGRLVAFEGIDGAGKSIQAARVAQALGARLTFEPGDTPLGAELRRLLLERADLAPTHRAEALLMAADRAQHVATVLEPTLAAGTHCVTDRYSGSTLAYQGYGSGLSIDLLHDVIGFATAGLVPDLTLLIDCDPETARGRLSANPDRLERLDPSYHARVRDGFLALAAHDPERWVVIDGAAPLEEVERSVDEALASRLGLSVAP